MICTTPQIHLAVPTPADATSLCHAYKASRLNQPVQIHLGDVRWRLSTVVSSVYLVRRQQAHLRAAAGAPRRDGSSCDARSSAAGWGRHIPGPLMERSSCRGGPSGEGGSAEVHRRLDLTWRSAGSCGWSPPSAACCCQLMSAKPPGRLTDAAPCTGPRLCRGPASFSAAWMQQTLMAWHVHAPGSPLAAPRRAASPPAAAWPPAGAPPVRRCTLRVTGARQQHAHTCAHHACCIYGTGHHINQQNILNSMVRAYRCGAAAA